MKQTIKHGAIIDALTPDEAKGLIKSYMERDAPRRIRATAVMQADADGNIANEDVYSVPPGWEFEARRVFLNNDADPDPNSNPVDVSLPGTWVEYRRSGTLIEYAVPTAGIQTWGAEQGPFISNGEVFQVAAFGFPANARLTVVIEGIIKRPHATGTT